MLHSPRRAPLLALSAVMLAGAGLIAAPVATAGTPPTASPASSTAGTGGGFVPVSATRVLDTRTGVGLGGVKGRLGPGRSLTSTLVNRAGLPGAGGATAVVLTLTSTNSTTGTYLSAYPGGASVPGTSSLNVVGGVTTANLVTVPLSADGSISVYNKAGSTDVVADLVGYYSSSENPSYGGLQPLFPERFFDSRTDGGSFGTNDYVDVPVDFGDPAKNAAVTAFVVNVTAVTPTGNGYFTVWDGKSPRPGTSSVSFRPGVTVANLVQVRRGTYTDSTGSYPGFRVAATLFGGRSHMVIDITGVFTTPGAGDDARFVPLTSPTRILDTRTTGSPALPTHAVVPYSISPVGDAYTVAVSTNLTIAGAGGRTYVTVFPTATDSIPAVSSINAERGAVVANASLLQTTYDTATSRSYYDIYNDNGEAPFIVDVNGTFEKVTTPAVRGSLWAPTVDRRARR